jgi:hypothetical protein
MKGLITIYSLCVAASLMTVRAEDSTEASATKTTETVTTERKRPALTAEHKAARKELVGKYDANKDGKLDIDERKKIAPEDKVKLKKAGAAQLKHRKVAKKELH